MHELYGPGQWAKVSQKRLRYMVFNYLHIMTKVLAVYFMLLFSVFMELGPASTSSTQSLARMSASRWNRFRSRIVAQCTLLHFGLKNDFHTWWRLILGPPYQR